MDEPIAGEQSPPPKRRRIRKGTQSCWECKRRKIRCTFVTPTETVCDGCKSRRAKCLSQEFYDEAAETSRKTFSLSAVGMAFQQATTRQRDALGQTNPPLLSTQCISKASGQPKGRFEKECSALLAVWPEPHELDDILSAPVSMYVLFHGLVCTPYSSFLSKDVPSPRDMIRLPPPGSHPTLLARQLLLLSTFLQGIPGHTTKDLGSISSGYKKIMASSVETASKVVTSNDDLVCSIEGVECIMIEVMYHNNAGNLRRAWVTHRRAMSIAQVLGLHQVVPAKPTVLDLETHDRVQPEHMWSRLIISDSYLSLMLGLPQCCIESPFGSPEALRSCSPMERMERMESIAGGLIIQRNGNDLHDCATTAKIDKLLQEAAALMPPQWWLVPNMATIIGTDKEAFIETVRLINQFTHYHLLAQLHLPYLLQSPNGREFDYSKTTAVFASREILLRFLAFRDCHPGTKYCRGIDLLAFVASTVLGLAHIDAHRQHLDRSNDCATTRLLAHQRLSDRGILERTLQCMERKAHDENDTMASGIVSILRRFLVIEAAASKGASYSTRVSYQPRDSSELETGGKIADVDGNLRIHIPHFGTITIEHRSDLTFATGYSPSQNTSQLGNGSLPEPTVQTGRERKQASEITPPSPDGSRHQIGLRPLNADFQDVPAHLETLRPVDGFGAAALGEGLFDFELAGTDIESLLAPDLAGDVGDWALQGVDMALFDNLIRGVTELDAEAA